MKLQGLVLTLPVCDLRPIVRPTTRRLTLSPDRAEVHKTYIKGFGRLEERKLWIPWRPADTIYYDCSGAISLPRNLPDGAAVNREVRRVYLDNRALVRFELALFTPPEHERPESQGTLDRLARDFWESEVHLIQQGTKTPTTLGKSLPRLVDRFRHMTSTGEESEPKLIEPLGAQIQVLAQEHSKNLSHNAKPIDAEGRIFLSIRSLRLQGDKPVDTVYLKVPFGYFGRPPGEEFQNLRRIRARIAWLHADLEVLAHILQMCNLGRIDPQSVSDYVIELARGLAGVGEYRTPNGPYERIVARSIEALHDLHGNRILRILQRVEISELSDNVKEEVARLLRGYLSMKERETVDKTEGEPLTQLEKTVVELDLVGYSTICANLEEGLDVDTITQLNEQIQKFIDLGLNAANATREESLMAETGDGAILVFNSARDAHRFARGVHEATCKHNKTRRQSLAKRVFRSGAASGKIAMHAKPGGGYDIAGTTIARAVRLEANAEPGGFLVDEATFESLTSQEQHQYGAKTRVLGKREEEFEAYGCQLNADGPKDAAFFIAKPKEESPDRALGRSGHDKRREVLTLFEGLKSHQYVELVFLLEIPIVQRPTETLNLHQQKTQVLQWADEYGKVDLLLELLQELTG